MAPRYDAGTPIVAQMGTHVRVAATVLILVAMLAGCSRTTTGTVAMTTEPGPSTARTSTPRTPSSAPRTPSADAPPDSLTMTCGEYSDLDKDTQLAVIDAILAQEGSVLGPQNSEIAKTLADAVCQFLPESTVSEILLGGGPP